MSPQQSNGERTPPAWGQPLTDADYSALEASWIDRKSADQAMLRRVGTEEGRQVVGQKGNGHRRHDHHPVLDWNMKSLRARNDGNYNIRPIKPDRA